MKKCFVEDIRDFPSVNWHEHGLELTEDQEETDVLLIGCHTRITDSFLDKFKNLKIIGIRATNTENIAISNKDINIVCLAKEDVKDIKSAAEFAFFMLLSLVKDSRRLNYNMSGNNYYRYDASDLSGKTVGIFGNGRIGRQMIRYCISFEMYIKVWNRREQDKWKMLEECDIISLHLPAKKEFINFINFDEIEAMKPTSYLINTARPYMINKVAMLEALREERIAGIAMDYCNYLDDNSIDRDLSRYAAEYDNFLMTPHVAGSSKDALKKAANALVCKVGKL